MKHIRLLHLMKTYNIGGVERSTINYSNLLVNKINFVGIFAKTGIFNHSNIINGKVKQFFSFGSVSNPFLFIINMFLIFRIMKDYHINCVNYHQRIFLPYIYFIKVFHRKAKILYSHHSVFNDNVNRFLLADTYIAFSKSSLKDIEKYSKSHAILIRHGIEIPKVQPKVTKGIKRIGFVGRFEKLKGVFFLLEAFRIISRENKDLELILIGEGREKGAMINFLVQNNLTDRVVIKSPTVCLDRLYEEIDCLVVPSQKHEGFGLVIIEAMARNIPVIASDLEAFKEIVQNGITGSIFKQSKVESLIEQIEKIIDERVLRVNIIKNGFEYVSSYHTIGECSLKYSEIVNTLNSV